MWERELKTPLSPMTNNQAKFAEWLFENESDMITGIGSLEEVFAHVRRFMKENRLEKEEE